MLFLSESPTLASGMFNASVEDKKGKKGAVNPEEVMCPKPAGDLLQMQICGPCHRPSELETLEGPAILVLAPS